MQSEKRCPCIADLWLGRPLQYRLGAGKVSNIRLCMLSLYAPPLGERAPVRSWEVGLAQESGCWEDSDAAHVNILLCDAARN